MVFDSIIKQEYYTILSINICIKLFVLMCEWTRTTTFNAKRHSIVKRQKVVSNNIIFPTKVAIPFFLNDYHNGSHK
jgi:hypothetical protein